jgi:hypothetical protein
MLAGSGSSAWRRFSKRHGYTGRKPARERLARLRSGAQGRAGELEMQTRRQVVLALVSAREPIVAQISELTIEIRHAVEAHPDGPTFPFAVYRCGLVAVRGDDDRRDRRLPRALPQLPSVGRRRRTGTRRRRVGQSQTRAISLGLDHRLRAAFCTLADASRRHHPWAADIYDRARARGASHTHATRILGRARSQIIWRLWHDHDTYEPQRHTALQKLIAA